VNQEKENFQCGKFRKFLSEKKKEENKEKMAAIFDELKTLFSEIKFTREECKSRGGRKTSRSSQIFFL
jgi:hypothetical protein